MFFCYWGCCVFLYFSKSYILVLLCFETKKRNFTMHFRLKTTYSLLVLALFIFSSNGSAQNYRKVTFHQIKSEGKIWGIDISHHQSTIDWKLLKKQKPHFIFFKATEGASHKDKKYTENYKNARKLCILYNLEVWML